MNRPDYVPEMEENLKYPKNPAWFAGDQLDWYGEDYTDEYEEVLEVLEEQDQEYPDPHLQFFYH